MSRHTDATGFHVPALVRSARTRAILALGMVFGLGAVGTSAAWSDTATATAGNFVTGAIDIQAGGQDTFAFTTLSLLNMPVGSGAPASSVSQIVRASNVGSIPLTYTVAASITGTNSLASALQLTVSVGATLVAGSCTGGTVTASAVPLTAPLLPTPQTLAANGGAQDVCIKVTLPAGSPAALAGISLSSIKFTFTGTAL